MIQNNTEEPILEDVELGDEEKALLDLYVTFEKRVRTRTRWLVGVIIVSGMTIAILGGLLIEKNALIEVRNIAVTTLKHERDSLILRDSLVLPKKP